MTSRVERLSLAARSSSAATCLAMPGQPEPAQLLNEQVAEVAVVLHVDDVSGGVVVRRRARVAGHGVGRELVVDGQVGLGQARWRSSSSLPRRRGGGLRSEAALVAQDVLDVLGADVAGLHDLGDGALGGGGAEELDEEGEPEGLAMDRSGSLRRAA